MLGDRFKSLIVCNKEDKVVLLPNIVLWLF